MTSNKKEQEKTHNHNEETQESKFDFAAMHSIPFSAVDNCFDCDDGDTCDNCDCDYDG